MSAGGDPDAPRDSSLSIRLFLSGRELTAYLARTDSLPPDIAIVIDVLRASTTLVYAFENGAARARAFGTPEEAVAAREGDPDALLCGERGGLKIPGYDLGNSPSEYTRDVVAGRTLFMTTTNGTLALARTAAAGLQLLAAYVNLRAVARRVATLAAAGARAGRSPEIWIVAAGKEDEESEEDTACARELERRLMTGEVAAEAGSADPALEAFLAHTEHGRMLLALEPRFAADLRAAARRDALSAVPEGRGGVLSRASGVVPE
ncbi:MAG: 2-phosphosulfolactate phosphatase [Candidatus Eiseniibacteriota bacterium]